MSAWYSISGTVCVRRCPQVDAIAAKIRAHCDRDLAVNLVPKDGEVDEFSIEGMGEFAACWCSTNCSSRWAPTRSKRPS
jgi:hypothetical protein